MIRPIRPLILVSVLLAGACNYVETFDAKIIGIDEATPYGLASMTGLEIDVASASDGPLVIRFAPCDTYAKKCETHTTLERSERHDKVREVNIVAGDSPLLPSDMRVGHNVIVNYALRGDLKPQNIEIRDYLPPTRFLRLDLDVSLASDTSADRAAETKMYETLLITQLSWRLPADIGIVRSTEVTDAHQVIGDIEMNYTQIVTDTQWVIRSKRTEEVVNLKTQLVDANMMSNWSDLRLFGGSQPVGNDAFSWSFTSSLAKLPMFELQPLK